MRTFNDLKEEEYEGCTRPRAFKKLLFALAFFNALILERRKFGAVGWNIPYEWMNSDLKAAIMQVRMYVEEQEEVPWDTLNVMTADITYGGRVTDVWDKRTIGSIIRRYFDPEVLNDGYRFSESGQYYAPAEGTLLDAMEYVRHLPMEDSPDTFGLHDNADVTFQQKETRTLLAAVIVLGGGGGGGGGGGEAGSSDALVDDIAAAIANRMPDEFDARIAHADTFKKVGDAVNSMGVFLGQELDRFNFLIAAMKASLKELRKAIKGVVVMSGPLEAMFNGFLLQGVPQEWENAGYPCLKPLSSWTEDFFARIACMKDWLENGPRATYWISGFFFPQGFMTAVKQTYSRDYSIAIDTLKVGCQVMGFSQEEVMIKPTDGVYIHGLFLEGARFDRDAGHMAESLPGELYDAVPCIWLKPGLTVDIEREAAEAAEEAAAAAAAGGGGGGGGEDGDMPAAAVTIKYNCPVYKTSRRAGTLSTTGHSTNFVVALDIPSLEEQNHWIRRGCAMLCMLND